MQFGLSPKILLRQLSGKCWRWLNIALQQENPASSDCMETRSVPPADRQNYRGNKNEIKNLTAQKHRMGIRPELCTGLLKSSIFIQVLQSHMGQNRLVSLSSLKRNRADHFSHWDCILLKVIYSPLLLVSPKAPSPSPEVFSAMVEPHAETWRDFTFIESLY